MAKDIFTKQWITENSLDIVSRYAKGILTLRGLHYQLVSIGMTNSLRHYKRVVNAMIDARWEGLVDFDTFSDLDRSMVGETRWKTTDLQASIEEAKGPINDWMEYYFKNRWENQEYYPEIFIEKKALQGVFQPICSRNRIALGACKGYPSLTFLHQAAQRFIEAESEGKKPIILYFGDYIRRGYSESNQGKPLESWMHQCRSSQSRINGKSGACVESSSGSGQGWRQQIGKVERTRTGGT